MEGNTANTNPAIGEMLGALGTGRLVVLGGSLIGFILGFFNWVSADSYGESAWHGWGIIAMLLFIVTAIWAALPLAKVQPRGFLSALPPALTEARLIMGAGLLAAFSVIVFIASEAPRVSFSESGSVSAAGLTLPGSASGGPSIIAYLGLLAALAIIVGGLMMQSKDAVSEVRGSVSALSLGRKLALAGSALGLLFVTLPWANASSTVSNSYGSTSYSVSSSESVGGWQGLGIIAVLLLLAVVLWTALPLIGVSVRGLLASLPRDLTEARLLMGAGGLAFICILIDMLIDNPVSGGSHGPSWGAFLALIAAAAIAAGGYLVQTESAPA